MKKRYLFGFITILLLTACSTSTANQAQKITAQEAKAKLDTQKGIILVDVRTSEEYLAEHIKNALLLPLDTIGEKASTLIPDKSVVYFVYCRTGNRSATAVTQLVNMGYQHIYDLGGINDWPYEKVSGS
jgi:phage shock protein E